MHKFVGPKISFLLFVAFCCLGECQPNGSQYDIEGVSFLSNGTKIVGQIFIPKNKNTLNPAITFIGPIGFVKEQSPTQYAKRLVQNGYITLIWDARYFGESDGQPRQFEDPMSKVQDIKASIDYLQSRPDVDKSRIAGVGICQGANWMIVTSTEDCRLTTLALISGNYLHPENLKGYFQGNPPPMAQRIERGRLAKEKYQKTGEVDYRQFVNATTKDVGVPFDIAYEYYNYWAQNGSRYQNRYTTMTDGVTWAFNIDPFVKQIKVPVVMVHGTYSDGGRDSVRHVFDEVPQVDETKRLAFYQNVTQRQFYDGSNVIDRAALDIAAFFETYLKN